MKNSTQSRSQVIIGFVQQLLLERRMSKTTFADDVKTIYHQRTEPEHRAISFHEGRDAFNDMKLNAQLLFRMLEADQHDVRLAADIEEAVVLALPEPYQSDCKTALASRYDMLPVYASHIKPEKSVCNISHFLRESSDTLDALSPMLADGVIDERDRPLAKRALKEMSELQGVLIELQGQILNILPDDGEPVLKVVD